MGTVLDDALEYAAGGHEVEVHMEIHFGAGDKAKEANTQLLVRNFERLCDRWGYLNAEQKDEFSRITHIPAECFENRDLSGV